MSDLKEIWLKEYKNSKKSLKEVRKVNMVASAFNTCIDAVVKISGEKLEKLLQQENITTYKQITNIKEKRINTPIDLLKGIFRCFEGGIAEEWIIENEEIYDWVDKNIGYDRYQMGGQAGIVANALSICGAKKVLTHCNSLPKLQAEQFLKRKNLVSCDEKGKIKPAHKINRKNDKALIHWIIEFDRDDSIIIGKKKITCPKANRFIATYDPLNLKLAIDNNFDTAINKKNIDYCILSGYHALTKDNDGVNLVKNSVPMIKKWKENNPNMILHLEVASTQDLEVRKAIVKHIIPLCDSIGVNERETIDILEVISEKRLAKLCEDQTTSNNLYNGLLKIREKTGAKRIQMHMFGLYITLQDKDHPILPEKNKKGMCLAATIAASKATIGNLDKRQNLLKCYGMEVSDISLRELRNLQKEIKGKYFLKTGIKKNRKFDVIATPTIIVPKPKTLVGMGDTISSTSLIGSV